MSTYHLELLYECTTTALADLVNRWPRAIRASDHAPVDDPTLLPSRPALLESLLTNFPSFAGSFDCFSRSQPGPYLAPGAPRRHQRPFSQQPQNSQSPVRCLLGRQGYPARDTERGLRPSTTSALSRLAGGRAHPTPAATQKQAQSLRGVYYLLHEQRPPGVVRDLGPPVLAVRARGRVPRVRDGGVPAGQEPGAGAAESLFSDPSGSQGPCQRCRRWCRSEGGRRRVKWAQQDATSRGRAHDPPRGAQRRPGGPGRVLHPVGQARLDQRALARTRLAAAALEKQSHRDGGGMGHGAQGLCS